MLFINWQPNGVRTSASLSWFFGGIYSEGFGEGEAEAAVRQLRESRSDKPLTVTVGEPLELFAVTNRSGGVMAGYVKYMRSVPQSPERSGGWVVKPQAIVHVRRFPLMAFSPSMDYSVTLPAGYALRATANQGQVSTHFSPTAKSDDYGFPPGLKPGDYHTTWFRPPQAPSRDYLDYPAQMQAQRTALAEQFQALLDRGPIRVVLGEPCQIFALTNKDGEVYRGFLELVELSPGGETTNTHQNNSARNLPPGNTSERTSPTSARTGASGRPPAAPANPRPAPSPRAPLPPAGPAYATPKLDPATGLPVPVGDPVPPGATSVLSPRLDPFGNPVPPGATSSGPRSN
jgi:hypothetical protein